MKSKEREIQREFNQDNLRLELNALVGANFYDAQETRKRAFNRLRQLIVWIDTGKKVTEKNKKKPKEQKYQKEYVDTKILKKIPTLLEQKKLTESQAQYFNQVIEILENGRKEENKAKKLITDIVDAEPLYQNYLKKVKGIGPLHTINLLRYFGYCEKAKHPSSLWRYAGLTPTSRMKEGEQNDKLFNPKLRTIMWKIGDSFVKKRTLPYRTIYDSEKKRQLDLMKDKAENAPKSLLHADLRARRKIVKHFLVEYYNMCMMLQGKTLSKPYSHRNDP